MNQEWRDLTWLHWAVEPDRVAHLLPRGVRPDTYSGPGGPDGATYVGLIPFRMVGAGFGPHQSVPWAGSFLETNVRLYSVGPDGRRGVVFLSLDADRLPVVLGARATLNLPYRWAQMSWDRDGDVHRYACRLRRPPASTGPARSRIRVRIGDRREPTPLDHFLADRWGLHVRRLGRLLYVPNQHGAWPTYDAEVLDLDDDLMASVGLPGLAHRRPDHVGFSPGVHTRFGFPQTIPGTL